MGETRSSRGRDRSRKLPAWGLLLLPVSLALGCPGPAEQAVSQAPVLDRAIPASPGEVRSAAWPRSEIGHETRPVLHTEATRVLRWRENVVLGETLRVETPLPDDLRQAPGLRIDHHVSVRDPSLPSENILELAMGGRIRFEAEPIVWMSREAIPKRVVVEIPVPEALQGREGLLGVNARTLPEDALVREETRLFEIPSGGAPHLEFGFAIEESGWATGFAPVRLRVYAASEDGTERHLIHERRVDPASDERDRRWFDAAVDLTDFAGRRVRFVFESEALAGAADTRWRRSFPVVSNPEVVAGSDRAGSRPNVMLISLDTLRARSLRLYGHSRDTMPNLDRRVAALGTRVGQVVAPFAFTPPSHMTMLTGLEPCAHGVKDRHDVLASNRDTLAELLRAAGYRTAAFTEDAYVSASAGFIRGFDTYAEFRSEEVAAPGLIAETFAAADRWLHTRAREPFFLFVHTYQVHNPYAPPRSYEGFFPEPVDVGQLARFDEDLRRYEQEIRYTDDMLVTLLDTLEETGLDDDTILIVTSDHGESFGEHMASGHGFTIADEEILVPLLIRAPGLVAEGYELEMQVGLVDLMPTILELVGLTPPAAMQGRSFAGLLGSEEAAARTGPAGSQRSPLGMGPPRISESVDSFRSNSHRRSVRTSRYKYVEQTGRQLREYLFRVDEDPRERRDLSKQAAALLAEGREALAAHDRACEAWNAKYPAATDARQPAERRPGWFVNQDELEAKLRSLGYTE